MRSLRALAFQPGIETVLAEPPLASHAHGGNLAGLDQPVDRPQVDLEVLQDFVGGQKSFIDHAPCSYHAHFIISRPVGNSIVNTAPPVGWLAARIWPPCS